MKIVVCIGSACHLKGSRQVIEQLELLIERHNIADKVDLSGTFCHGDCKKGVCVTLDGELHSVLPDNVGEFFDTMIMQGV